MLELFDLGMSHLAYKELFSLNRRDFNNKFNVNNKNMPVVSTSMQESMAKLRLKAWAAYYPQHRPGWLKDPRTFPGRSALSF